MANSTPHKDRDPQTEPARLAEEREHAKFWRWVKTASDWIKAKSKKHRDEAEWALGRRAARALEGVALFAVSVALLLVFLDWFIDPTKPKERQGLALVLAISLGGIAAFVGLYLTGQQLRTTRELEETRAREEERRETNRARDAGLRASLEQVGRLVTDANWDTQKSEDTEDHAGSTLRELAQAEVLSVLGTLDGPRKRILVRFLYESKLANKENPKKLDLSWADLSNADLNNSKLPKAALSGVRLGGANLSNADLRGANLQDAILQGAILQEANLYRADLYRANLQGANLQEAILQGADLRGATGMTQDQIEWTIGSEETELPEYLHRPELWSKSLEEQVEIAREHLGEA